MEGRWCKGTWPEGTFGVVQTHCSVSTKCPVRQVSPLLGHYQLACQQANRNEEDFQMFPKKQWIWQGNRLFLLNPRKVKERFKTLWPFFFLNQNKTWIESDIPYFYEVDCVRFLHVHRVLSRSLLCLCHTDLHFSQQSSPSFHHLHKQPIKEWRGGIKSQYYKHI